MNHILVDVDMKWTTWENTDLDGNPNGRKLIDDETDKETYNLLCVQLRSTAEKKAGQIAKSIMNELERRLLQRAQSGWFETFLVAMLLLNCVERSSWLFQTWNAEEYKVKVMIMNTCI